MEPLRRALKVRPGEGRTAALVAAVMFLTSVGGSVGGSGIEALFYGRFGVRHLPAMYVALGPIMVICSFAISGLFTRVGRESVYRTIPIVLAAVLVGERLTLATGARWPFPVLWLSMNAIGVFQSLVAWGLAGTVNDTRQAKRLFPLYGAGQVLGAVVGGLVTKPLAAILHAENLIFVWTGALLAATVVVRSLLRRRELGRGRAPAASRGVLAEMQEGARTVVRSPLLRRVAAATLLLSLLLFSLAFSFSRAATARFPEVDDLAGFLGLFYGISMGAALLVSVAVANRLFTRFGVASAVLVLPMIYVAGFVSAAAVARFGLLVVFRFVQMVWLFGVQVTAIQALFNVVSPDRRDQARTFITGVAEQIGTVASGLLLIVAEAVLSARELYVAAAAIAVVAAAVLWRVRRAYVQDLVTTLRAGRQLVFHDEEEPFGGHLPDATAVEVAARWLSDPDPSVRRLSVDLLAGMRADDRPELLGAVDDPSPEVRAAAVRALGGHAGGIPGLLGRLTDPEPVVRAAAVAALGDTEGAADHADVVRPILADEDPAARAAAAATLSGWGEEEATRALKDMVTRGTQQERAVALRAIGRSGATDELHLAVTALRDPAPAVRVAAARSLGELDPGSAVPHLVEALADEDGSVRRAVALALSKGGDAARDDVVVALADPSREEGALMALEQGTLDPQRSDVRAYVEAAATMALRYDDLARLAGREEADERARLFVDSLRHRAQQEALLAFRAGALLAQDPEGAREALRNLTTTDPAQRANALEAVEATGDPELARPLLRLWEPEERARPERSLAEALRDADPWIRACAALFSRDSDDRRMLVTLASLAQSDPDELVRAEARIASDGPPGEVNVETLKTLSVMDQVLFLRRVALFADLPPDDLRHVAAIVRERVYGNGEAIARQGETGDELFIIVSGWIRVVAGDGERDVELARRGPGEFVGETAILSAEPRMATLVAEDEVRVMVVGKREFEAMIRDRPETSLAVMRSLANRLREAATRSATAGGPRTA